MKTLLLLFTLAILCQLALTQTDYETLLERTWFSPGPALRKKIDLTVDEYAVWTALTKFVEKPGTLRETFVNRFCKCKSPMGKRSLKTRVKRANGTPKKIIRREWRRMSTKMKRSFVLHFNKISMAKGEDKSWVRIFADWHRRSESPGAHGGPAFLPWHRAFLFRLEQRLRGSGYPGALPYWDSTLEENMTNPADSILFTSTELGVSKGRLGKPFLRYQVSSDCEKEGNQPTRFKGFVHRNANENTAASTMKRNEIYELFEDYKGYENFSKRLERIHGQVHFFFGDQATLAHLSCVGFEPMFYLHHTFIDYLWEKFREKQSPQDRENDYPTHTNVTVAHLKYRDMLPFDNLDNIMGLRSQYTNTFYGYEESPYECKLHRDCKSPMLWCNKGKCQGKIKAESSCKEGNKGAECYCPNRRTIPVCDEDGWRCRCAQKRGK